jgi:hypothetical protein
VLRLGTALHKRILKHQLLGCPNPDTALESSNRLAETVDEVVSSLGLHDIGDVRQRFKEIEETIAGLQTWAGPDTRWLSMFEMQQRKAMDALIKDVVWSRGDVL